MARRVFECAVVTPFVQESPTSNAMITIARAMSCLIPPTIPMYVM